MGQTNVFTYKSLINITPYDLILSSLFLKGLKTIPMSKLGYNKDQNLNQTAIYQVSEASEATNEVKRSPKTFTLFIWKNFA
jgi:hypothetical protein